MSKSLHLERKVSKFGNSLGLTMTEAFKQLGLEAGDKVEVNIKENSEEIVIKKVQKVDLPAGISPDFLDTLSQVMGQYDTTLNELKDR
ncbi:AbrB family transcriptional regulator [Paenibacillus sp. KACC 21273]|uniref:AbrB/MazE/SpoVT family DNA-binding domain-containing protein n=1 Tax=Paenibacillus sp. KACC 21273 TaxID=3025665 RepID=UPI0023661ADA|nr:AbrB family transcriptional regulator [Paenibacillus sp. KACC 21273]WDF50734.1 AbrB family transcriptional regulator [Paenibacillus sp. KACC 21273]